MSAHPKLLHTVLDAPDVRQLAEFWRQLLGLQYRSGDEPPTNGEDDAYWLVLTHADGRRALAFQHAADHQPPTWPRPGVPQQLHLDLTVPTAAELDAHHERVLSLGATLLLDRRDDSDEPLRAYADPAGHPFCIFVAPR